MISLPLEMKIGSIYAILGVSIHFSQIKVLYADIVFQRKELVTAYKKHKTLIGHKSMGTQRIA